MTLKEPGGKSSPKARDGHAKHAGISRVLELAERLHPFEIEAVDKEVWESIPRRAEKAWRNA